MDAYQRAADLDPSNIHIKARLQLLRNNGQSTGMPNQQGAPVPQDVHPQQYQAAGVGAPPGPQWGVPGPGSMPQGPGPVPAGPAHDWTRRLAEIQQPQPQPQPPNPYDQRDAIRAPLPQRQLSPRQEQMRQYQEQHRHTPVRRPSPPNVHHMGSNSYPGQQGLPQPLGPPASQPSAPNRITNPNYGAPGNNVGPPQSGSHGGSGPMPPYGRGNSPLPEIRPIAEDRAPSPGPSYPHPHHYHPAPPSQPVGIAAGAPPPVAALVAAEAAAQAAARGEREERSHSGIKRMLDSEDEYKGMHKVPANGENRNRLDETRYRRPSPPDRKPSPRQRPSSPRGRQPSSPIRHRRSSSEDRHEEQRRVDENYHPSEAAHHPPTLPSMHQQQPQQAQEHLPPINDTGREERSREAYESAARQMDVDEDYDDEGDDEKPSRGSGGRNSPQRGMMNGPTKIEAHA